MSALPICLELGPLPPILQLTLPGGVTMEAINLAEIVQPALTPLVPIFQIVDAVVAVFNCIQAIPDSLGPPPNPAALSACLPDLAEKIAVLVRLIPLLSLPYMVVQLLDLVIETLRAARSQLIHLQAQMRQLTSAIDRATNLQDAGLMAIIQCTQANIAQEAANVGQSLASLGRLIGLINLFLGMLGLPEVPSLTGLAGTPLDEVIGPLNDLIRTMQTARDAVPLP